MKSFLASYLKKSEFVTECDSLGVNIKILQGEISSMESSVDDFKEEFSGKEKKEL